MKKIRIWIGSALVFLIATIASGQTNIIPTRTDVSGFSTWTDTDVAGTTYLQLLKATSSTISPAMNFDSYTSELLNYKARSYGGTNAPENTISIWISTDNGSSWTSLGTSVPGSSTMTAMPQIDLSAYNGTQVRIKFTVAGTSNTVGAGIDDITITGIVSSSNSNTSDLIVSPGYSYPQNINYLSYQSTNIVADANDLEIAKFRIRDGGGISDADALGTTLTSITFNISNYSNIRRIALYDGATEIGTEQAGAGTVTFSSLNLTAPDDGTKDFSVRVSFNTSVIDNQNIGLTVTAAGSDVTGSTFASGNAGGAVTENTGNSNKIVVTADRLVFSVNKPPALVIPNVNFNVEVKAADVNGNVDIDQSTPVTVAKETGSGLLNSATGLTQSLVNGVYSWPDIQYNQTGTFTITASDGVGTGLTDVTSGVVTSQLNYLDENFEYGASNNADLLAVTSNWSNHSGTGNPGFDAGGLSYANYCSSSKGGKVTFSGASGGDINRVFGPITSTSNIYVSFLINLASANASAEYFMHFGPSSLGSIFRGRIFARSNGVGWSVGLSKAGETPVADNTVLSFNQTYLVIVKYAFSTAATTDDQVSLWMYDAGVPDTEGSGSPIVTIAATGSGTDGDPADIGCIAIRQSANIPTGSIDGIRIAASWVQAPLPVELTSFTAAMRNSRVVLSWKTATEVNNRGFDVEKNVNGTWTKIAFVAGNGTSNAAHEYSYVDAKAAGSVSYRLKQIDNDGAFKYSNVATVEAAAPKGFELCNAYPNPFNPATQLRFAVPENGVATLIVYNALGQQVATLYNGMAQAGQYITATFNAGQFASGVYVARLQFNGKSMMQKMMLAK